MDARFESRGVAADVAWLAGHRSAERQHEIEQGQDQHGGGHDETFRSTARNPVHEDSHGKVPGHIPYGAASRHARAPEVHDSFGAAAPAETMCAMALKTVQAAGTTASVVEWCRML